jgi:hypothetical protein
MAPKSPPRRLRGRRRALWASLSLAVVAAALASLGAGWSLATRAQTQTAPSYAALGSGEATGLRIVDEPTPSAANSGSTRPAGPTWPANPPAGAGAEWPITSSIRRVPLGAAGMSAWIADSYGGGICVLLYDGVPVGGVDAVYTGCSTPEGRARGASVEVSDVPGMPGKVIMAGVVPDGVTAVGSTLADGTSATTPVSGNAWARVGEVAAAPDTQPTNLMGGR